MIENEQDIKNKLTMLYNGWSMNGLTKKEQAKEFNTLLNKLELVKNNDSLGVVSNCYYSWWSTVKYKREVAKRHVPMTGRRVQNLTGYEIRLMHKKEVLDNNC